MNESHWMTYWDSEIAAFMVFSCCTFAVLELKVIVHPKMKILSLITFTKLMRILFVRKENHNNLIYSTILLPELPSSSNLESTPEPNQRNQCSLCSACVFFAHKKYSRSFVKLRLNHWCHMDYCTDVLARFLDLGTLQLHCCIWRIREPSDLIKNIWICFPKMKKGLTGLERHEYLMTELYILGEL